MTTHTHSPFTAGLPLSQSCVRKVLFMHSLRCLCNEFSLQIEARAVTLKSIYDLRSDMYIHVNQIIFL